MKRAIQFLRPQAFAKATLPLLSCSVLLFGAPVMAQPDEDARDVLEEVVVTARRSAESLADVPIAVSAFTATDIEDAGIRRPEDFINLTSNVVMANTVNVGDTLVTIRGITSTRDAESNFALVVDGVLITNPNAFNRELLDIEQIEVLKGPQGGLYGRNATSGAILLTTQKPTEEASGQFVVGLGTNNSELLQGNVSAPLTDNLGLRLAFSQRSTDGEKRNLFTGNSDVDFFDDQTLRARLFWDIGDNTSLDFRFGESEASGGTINFNATFAVPGFANAFNIPEFHIDVNDHVFRYQFNVPPLNEQETNDFSLKFDHEFGNGYAITAVLARNELDERLLSDGTSASFGIYSGQAACGQSVTTSTLSLLGDTPPTVISATPGNPPGPNDVIPAYTPLTCDGYQYQERNQKDLSLEVRVASPSDGKLRWIAGAWLADIEREVVVAYGADLGRGFNPQPYVAPDGPNPTDLLFWDQFDTTVMSLFGQLAVDLGDSLELSFEARYDTEDRDVTNLVPQEERFAPYALAGGIESLNPARGSSGTEAIPSRSDSFSQFQPKLALRWNLAEHSALYASYGVGFRSGGFNSLGSQNLIDFWFGDTSPFDPGIIANTTATNAMLQVNDSYDKEVTTAFEVGYKGNFLDNRLKFNAAVFQTEVEDNQFFEFFAGPFGLMRVVTTIEQLDIFGIELDFNWLITEGLRLYGSYGMTDGEIKQNDHRPYTVGNEAPLAPENTLNLGLQWERPINNVTMVARLDVNHVGETWFHTVQDNSGLPTIWYTFGFSAVGSSDFTRTSRDAFTTIDARLAFHADTWGITLWGRNITDEDYLAEIIPAPEFGGSFIHEAPQSTYGVDFSYRF